MQRVNATTRDIFRKKFSRVFKRKISALNKRGYDLFVISCYTHWLTEEEADKEILNFHDLKPEDAHMVEYLKREQNFLNFYKELYDKYAILLSFNNELENFYKCSIEEYINACRQSVREENFVSVTLPKKNIVLSGTFDSSILCYYPIKEDIDDIKKMVVNNNLFILS